IAIAPDVSAPNGLNGLWLLDPANIRIVAGTTNANITDTIVGDTNIFDSAGSPEQEALLGVDLILAALANGTDVEVRTTGDEPGEGNITLEASLDFDDTNGSLALLAEGAIEIQAEILDSASFFAAPFFEFPGENIDDLNLTLQANGPINIFGNIDTGRGNINIESLQDDINISSQLTTSSGDINITASQGEINIAAPILTSEPRTSSAGGEFSFFFFPGGNVTIESQEAITVDEIATSSVNQIAGDIFIQSLASTIDTGIIDASSSAESLGDGGAGDVTLKATDNIVFSSIDASNDIGDAGNVFIESETATVRGIDLIPDSSATISAEGAGIDGSITIAHNGGSTNTPFDLGNAATNGTIGTLTTRAITLEDGNPNEPFLGSFEADNIEIITSEEPENEVDPSIDIPGCIADCDTTNRPQDLPAGSRATDPETAFRRFEEQLTSEVVDYLKSSLSVGESFPIFNGQSFNTADLPTVQANLLKVQNQTGKRPALIYAVFGASDLSSDANEVLQATVGTDSLELLLITAQGKPTFIRLPATREQVLRLAQRFRRQVATPGRVNTKTYLQPAQELYQLLITPLEAELKKQNIDTISFITDAGLRSIPLAALHDGKGFIIENYNVGLMPSLSLTDLTYQDISNVSALLAGTSAFANQTSLPGVPVELAAISSKWRGKVLQGDAFGLDMLKDERQRNPYGIIHLATHGEFNVGDLSKSYLYFHNERIRLDQLRTLGLNRPSVELLTLSACQTALGNRSAELGFAGFAVLAGAKTSVASLWNISDEASAGLMIDFYQQLQENPQTIKAEALRAAQLAMLQGKIRVNGDQLLISAESRQLPIELAIRGQQDFTHPYYWAAFSLIGSPW
ncbi:MAG: CHAT domain-containing protein, partial [Cyanobacteria bacterium P01_D01_bin.56]